MLGHDTGVCTITASSDGCWTASGGANGKHPDLGSCSKQESSKECPSRSRAMGFFWSIVFATSFASASWDRMVRVLERETGQDNPRTTYKVGNDSDSEVLSVSYGRKLTTGTDELRTRPKHKTVTSPLQLSAALIFSYLQHCPPLVVVVITHCAVFLPVRE